MKDKMKKIIFWRPDRRLVACLAVLALGLLLLPLLRIALYSAPWYDDYGYGGFVKGFLDQERSLKSALEGAVYGTKVQWYAWQGTFSSIFFMTLVPLVWGEEYYFLGPLFLICILTIAVWVFMKVLARDVLKADRASAVILASGVTAMVVVMIYHANHGFYWYNAGIHYVGMHAFLLLLIAAWIKLLTDRGRVKTVLLVLWTLAGAVLAGGSNYVTSLQGLLVGLGIAAAGAFLYKKRAWLLCPSMAVYLIAFYLNISAPGNEVRGAIYRDCGMSTDAVTAVLRSFLEAFHHIGLFSWQMTLAVMLLLAPIIWRIVKGSNCRFRYPGIVLIASVCLYATGFTSSLYVTGAVALARVVNAVKITYQILVIINEIYWLGWACRKWESRNAERKEAQTKNVPLIFYLAVGMLMWGIFLSASPVDREGHYASWAAYHYVHTGEAYENHRQYLERVAAMKGDEEIVRVDPYMFRPWILAVLDLSSDPGNEANGAMAGWYHKQAIICSLEETE